MDSKGVINIWRGNISPMTKKIKFACVCSAYKLLPNEFPDKSPTESHVQYNTVIWDGTRLMKTQCTRCQKRFDIWIYDREVPDG